MTNSINIYIRMYVYICIHTNTQIGMMLQKIVSMYIYTNVRIYAHTYTHARTSDWHDAAEDRVNTDIHKHVYIYECTFLHTHAHTHTHKHVHKRTSDGYDAGKDQ